MMNHTRIIKFFENTKPIRISYYENETYIVDNPIVTYEDYKLTVRLTGELATIVNNNVIYAERGDVLILILRKYILVVSYVPEPISILLF